MSFRRRLTLFFVILVIVPMIAVTAVLFRLISTNETGKANANLSARTRVAAQVYHQDANSPMAVAAATLIARDPALGAAVMSGNVPAASARARMLLGTGGVIRIAWGQAATPAFDVGDSTAIAPVSQRLVAAGGQSLGRLVVSPTSAAEYARQTQALTGMNVVVRSGTRVLASTQPAVAVVARPRPVRDAT